MTHGLSGAVLVAAICAPIVRDASHKYSIHVYSEANGFLYLYQSSCSFPSKFAFWGLSMDEPRRRVCLYCQLNR